MNMLGGGDALRDVDRRGVAVGQPHRRSWSLADFRPRHHAFVAGGVAHAHAGIGDLSEFDHLAIVAQHLGPARRVGVMHAIEQPDLVAGGQWQPAGRAAAVGRGDHCVVGADLPGRLADRPDRHADVARRDIRLGRYRQPVGRIVPVGLHPVVPELRHALRRGVPAAGDQQRGAVLALHLQRLGGPALPEQAGDGPLTLGLLPDRGQDLRDLILAERRAQQIDDGAGLHALALLFIAELHQLEAVLLLQPHQLELLAGADQAHLIDHHDAVAIRRIAAGLDPLQERRQGGAIRRRDAGRGEIGCLPPGDGRAEDLPSVRFPGVDEGLKGGRFSAAGRPYPHAQPAAGGEPQHHLALRLPMRAGRIDGGIACQERIGGGVDLLRCQRRRSVGGRGGARPISSRSRSSCSEVVTDHRSLPRSGASLPMTMAVRVPSCRTPCRA